MGNCEFEKLWIMVVRKSEKELRQAKMMLLLPLVVVPLLALAFHALGGGWGASKEAKPVARGLNMALPEARFDPKKKGLNKLGAYGQADRDSAKMAEWRKQDPYSRDSVARHGWLSARAGADTGWRRALVPGGSSGVGGLGSSRTDAQADELMGKLDRLKEVLRRQEERPVAGVLPSADKDDRFFREPVVPATIRPVVGSGDPDLDKLNAMLDKVLKIQHPEEAVKDTVPLGERRSEIKTLVPLPAGSVGMDTGQVLEVSSIPGPGGGRGQEDNGLGSGFMDIDGGSGGDSLVENTVAAVIARDQTLVSGASVELRLDQDAVVSGRVVPRGASVWGKAALSGERLTVAVSSVRVGGVVIPVNMEVFDLDGMVGIRVEGSINRDAAKASADEAVGSLGVPSLDPSLAGQATAAGIQAARTLLTRKVRLVRVSLRAGYRVLLKNGKL